MEAPTNVGTHAPGFHQITREQYDAAPGVRNTEIGWAARSMKHWLRNSANPTKETEAKRDGRLIHKAILEPDVFDRTTIVLPPDAPKHPTKAQINAKKPSPETVEAIAWWKDFGIKNAGRTIISAEDSGRIQNISDAVLDDEVAGPIIAACKRRELAVFTRHDSTGLLLKSSLDLLADDDSAIWDIKKTVNAEPDKYRRDFTAFGYHRQSAFYPDHFPRLGLKTPSFGQIIVEDEPPYVVSVRYVDADSIEIGRKEYNALLHLMARCQQTKRYPGYHTGIDETGLTLWRLKEALS